MRIKDLHPKTKQNGFGWSVKYSNFRIDIINIKNEQKC